MEVIGTLLLSLSFFCCRFLFPLSLPFPLPLSLSSFSFYFEFRSLREEEKRNRTFVLFRELSLGGLSPAVSLWSGGACVFHFGGKREIPFAHYRSETTNTVGAFHSMEDLPVNKILSEKQKKKKNPNPQRVSLFVSLLLMFYLLFLFVVFFFFFLLGLGWLCCCATWFERNHKEHKNSFKLSGECEFSSW